MLYLQHRFNLQRVFRIRKILAIALLLAFTIGVTPKVYFHELFSNHTDYSCAKNDAGKTQFNSYKFNCGFVNIEGVSPFLEAKQTDPGSADIFLQCYPDIPINEWVQLRPERTQHRGPPALT
jgi:hypothetical protein